MQACMTGEADVVRVLLERQLNPDLDAEDMQGETPLIKAVRHGNPQIVLILLQTRPYAIDPHLPNHLGNSAVDYAHHMNNHEIVSYFTSGLQSIKQIRTIFSDHIISCLDAYLPVVLSTTICAFCFRTF